MAATQALADALHVIYREATKSPWVCLHALRESTVTGDVPRPATEAPVLVLGGFLSHPYYYAPLGKLLAQQGYAVHYDEVFNALPFRSHVASLVDRARALADAAGQPVRVVGHSLGGLQAAALMLEAPEAVGQITMVASPIVGGTPWRPLQRLAERVLEVRGSDTDLLRTHLELHARRVTTISFPQDLVAPPSVCTLEGATNVILSTVPRRDEGLASHIGVIFMQTVVRIILATLARPIEGPAPRHARAS